MVYCSCHGVSYGDRQVILLNSDNQAEAFFKIEYFLRDLVRENFTEAKVFSLYDCCRDGVETNPILRKALAGKGADGQLEPKRQGDSAKYMHICAANAGQTAALDAKFAKKTYEHVLKI